MGTVYLGGAPHGLQLWPEELGVGDRLRIAFVAPAFASGKTDRWEVIITDDRRRPVATVLDGPARRSAGVVAVEWDGRNDRGEPVPSGIYRVEVTRPGGRFRLERTFLIAG